MDKEIRLGRFDKWGYKNSFSKGELARELTYMNRDYDQLEQHCKKQNEVIAQLKNKTKENIENAKYEITTLTIGDKAYYQYIEKILDNYVDILKEVE